MKNCFVGNVVSSAGADGVHEADLAEAAASERRKEGPGFKEESPARSGGAEWHRAAAVCQGNGHLPSVIAGLMDQAWRRATERDRPLASDILKSSGSRKRLT